MTVANPAFCTYLNSAFPSMLRRLFVERTSVVTAVFLLVSSSPFVQSALIKK